MAGFGRVSAGRPEKSKGGGAVKQHHRYATTGKAPQDDYCRADIGFKKTGKAKGARKKGR